MSFALSRRAFLGAVTAVAASSAFAAGSAPGKRALIIYYFHCDHEIIDMIINKAFLIYAEYKTVDIRLSYLDYLFF